jgi:acyl-coenzyme A thioesterase PaaI-like protein
MEKRAIQDYYPSETAICYGCGRNNPDGLKLKTHWNGEEGILNFTPRPSHTAFPGVVYGGLIASLIDCHSIGTAVAAAYDSEGRSPDTNPEITYVTGNLNVTYLKPTPMGAELELRARPKEVNGRKTVVACSLYAKGEECARGEVICVRVPSRQGIDLGKKRDT